MSSSGGGVSSSQGHFDTNTAPSSAASSTATSNSRKLLVVAEDAASKDSSTPSPLSPGMRSPTKKSGGGEVAVPKTPGFNPSGAPQTPKGEVAPTPTATHTMAVVHDDVKRCVDTGTAQIWCSCRRCENIYPDSRHWARGVIDRKGRTPLHNACIWGDEARVMTLLKAAAKNEEVSFRQKTVDKEGATVLHLGAPFPGVLELLFLMHTFDEAFICLAERKYGYTALHRAAQAGASKSVSMLVERGIQPQVMDSTGRTPLHIAARSGHEECAMLLLNLGASASATDRQDRSSIEYARCFGQNALARALEEHVNEVKRKALDTFNKAAGVANPATSTGTDETDGEILQTAAKKTMRRASGRANTPKRDEVAGVQGGAHAEVMATKDIVPDAHTLQLICTEGRHAEVPILLKKAKVKDIDIMLTHDRDVHRIAMHCAAKSGHNDVIKELLQHKPYGGRMGGGHTAEEIAKKQLSHQDIAGCTPLHLAIQENHESTALLLLKSGTPMKTATHRGELALHLMGRCASKWRRESLQRFIRAHKQAGLSLDQRDSAGKTAMNYAAEENQVQIVAFLLDNGASLDSGGEGSRDTPGHASARRDFAELTEFLVKLDAKVFHVINDDGWTPLHEASLHGCLNAANAILAAGLHPDMRPLDAAPPSEALWPGFLSSPRGEAMAQQLKGVVHPGAATGRPSPRRNPGFRQAMVSPTKTPTKTPHSSSSPSTPPAASADDGNAAVALAKLPDVRAEPLRAERFMMTPLMCAVIGDNLEVAKTLLAHGADPAARDYKGRGLLHHAALHSNYYPFSSDKPFPCPARTATFLLEFNLATPQVKDKCGRSPLHYCALRDAAELSRVLVHHRAVVNCYDASGRAPLHDAARYGAAGVAETLIEGHADVSLLTRDARMVDAVTIAQEHKSLLVVSVLHKAYKQHGAYLVSTASSQDPTEGENSSAVVGESAASDSFEEEAPLSPESEG